MYESLACYPSLRTYIFLFVPLGSTYYFFLKKKKGSTYFYHKRECIILFCFVFCFKIQVLVLYIKQKENYTNFHQSLLKLHYHPIVSNYSHSYSLKWRLKKMIKKSYIFTFTFIFSSETITTYIFTFILSIFIKNNNVFACYTRVQNKNDLFWEFVKLLWQAKSKNEFKVKYCYYLLT